MPRPRFSNWPVADRITGQTLNSVSVGASAVFHVDLQDTFFPQFLLMATYPVTGSTCGLTCTIYPGFAVDAAQDVIYADNGNAITEFGTTKVPTINTGTPQTQNIAFAVSAEVYPRYLKLILVNPDTHNVMVTLVGDR